MNGLGLDYSNPDVFNISLFNASSFARCCGHPGIVPDHVPLGLKYENDGHSPIRSL